ncbi:MAG: hypothetical protein ACRECD_12760 [Burkholderiaceae bacterium]
MNTFLKTYRLALTPLSPIHIGCGEDFEPTNYVIDDGVLYGFDPSRAVLTDVQKSRLTDAANKASLQAIQRFFRDNAKDFKPHADVLIPVSSGVAQAYEQRIGRAANIEASGNAVFNQLAIERTSYTGLLRQPYIPGSSFKGAFRTSDLNRINASNPIQYGENTPKGGSTKLEKRLYEEKDFDMSPMRLIKVSDLMPNAELDRSVTYAVMRRKRFVRDPATGEEKQTQDNLSTRKEIISHGQYRGLAGQVTMPLLGDLPDSDKTPKAKFRHVDIVTLAHASNAYHLPKLEEELKILDSRRFASERWLVSLRKLLASELGLKLKEGSAFLVRLGRYGGAETKTLDGIRSIHIPQAKRLEEKYVTSSHCLWLAANDSRARSDLLPFGWAVVEIDPQADLPQLKAWCAAESKGRPDMAQLRQQFEAEKLAASKRKLELLAEAAEREAAKLAEQAAAEQRAQALASMTPQGQLIETLRQQCEDLDEKISHGNFKKQKTDAGQAGLYQDASRLVKAALEGSGWSAADKLALADMLEQWLPKVVTPWDAKEQRKKLKLAALRGLT